jgi:hypothetical protein
MSMLSFSLLVLGGLVVLGLIIGGIVLLAIKK